MKRITQIRRAPPFLFLTILTLQLVANASEDIGNILKNLGKTTPVFRIPTPGYFGSNSFASFVVTDSSKYSKEVPISVYGLVESSQGIPIFLSEYEFEGGVAEIQDAFLLEQNIDPGNNLFVICKWRTHHRGEGIFGDYYKVDVFQNKAVKSPGNFFVATKNDSLTKLFGQGFDGTWEGKDVNFAFTSKESITERMAGKMIDFGEFLRSCRQTILNSSKTNSPDLSCAMTLANSPSLRVFKITAKNVSAINDIGYFLAEGKKFEESIRILEKVVIAIPDRTVAYLNLGDSYWGMGDSTNAKYAYKKYCELMRKEGKNKKIPDRASKRSDF